MGHTIYFILLAVLWSSLDLSSLTRDGTWVSDSGSIESSSLDYQGIPSTNVTESALFYFLEKCPYSSFGWLCFQLKCESVPYVCYEVVVHPKVWLYSFLKFIYLFIYFSFIYISWRLIPLQYCSGFCHTLIWISHGFTCVPHPEQPSHLPPHPIPLGHPSAPAPGLCVKPGLAICFSALLSDHPTLAFSPRVLKSVLYICDYILVQLFVRAMFQKVFFIGVWLSHIRKARMIIRWCQPVPTKFHLAKSVSSLIVS